MSLKLRSTYVRHIHKLLKPAVHFKKTQKKFFVNNFCVSELYTLKFLTQEETMVTQISATSPSPGISGKSFVKKIAVFTFQQFVPTSHMKLRSLNEKLQVWVFQGQDFAFWASINMSYKEVAAIRVTHISFLSLINLKICFTLVNSNIYCQKMLNQAFLMHVFAKIFI